MNKILLRNIANNWKKIDQKIKWHKGKLCVPSELPKLRSLSRTSMHSTDSILCSKSLSDILSKGVMA